MKSWLTSLAQKILRTPPVATETSWRAEDFRATPEQPVASDPWASDKIADKLNQNSTLAPAGLAEAMPAAGQTHGLQQQLALELHLSAEQPSQPAEGNSREMAAPPHERDASPEGAPVSAPLHHVESLAAAAPEAEVVSAQMSRLESVEVNVAAAGLQCAAPDSIAGLGENLPQGNLTANERGVSAGSEAAHSPHRFTHLDDFAPGGWVSTPDAITVSDDDNFELPDYDPDLSQRLGDDDWAARAPQDALARQRAAMIAALLDVPSRHEERAAVQWLEGFFLEHHWPATFRAIKTIALEGLDFRTLQAMARLKEIWADTPEWWLLRSKTNRDNLFKRLPRGDIALTWRIALSICRARCDFPPDNMIDEDWLSEWYALSPAEPGAISFPAFLHVKAQTMLVEALHEGLVSKGHEYEPPSPGASPTGSAPTDTFGS